MKDQPPLPHTFSTDTLLSPTTTILPSQQFHDIYINQGRDLFVQSLYSSIAPLMVGKLSCLQAYITTHMCNMFALSKPSTTPQVKFPSTQQVVPSTPQIIP